MVTFNQIRKLLTLTRLKPFDTSTVEGRSNERLRRVFWTAATSTLAKGINTLTVIVSVPITLGYLGSERFGLWMTISSFIAFLGFADLGIGNGVLNLISEADGKNDVQAARRGIASAFFLLFCITASLTFLFLLIYPHVTWGKFLNVSSPTAMAEAGPSMVVLLVCILANLPLSIIPRIQMGYQEGYVSSIWLGVSGLLGLAGLIAAVVLKAGLPWLIFVIAGSPAVANLLNGLYFFIFQRRWLIPRWQDINLSTGRHILSIGLFFVILQVTNAINYSADNLIIAKILGASAVTDYSVPFKLFSLISIGIYMALAPLWPAYGEANARGDTSWARNTLTKVITSTCVLCILASLFLLVFGEPILRIWTGSKVPFSLPLMIGFGIWTSLQSVITSMALFLNAINKIRFQAVFTVLTAVFSVVARIVLANSAGLRGVVWGNIIASFFLMLIPYSIYLISLFTKQSEKSFRDRNRIE